MSTRRGKKLNQVKNYVAAADFAAGKRIGRPKQVFVLDDGFTEERYQQIEKEIGEPVQRKGHWEKANVLK